MRKRAVTKIPPTLPSPTPTGDPGGGPPACRLSACSAQAGASGAGRGWGSLNLGSQPGFSFVVVLRRTSEAVGGSNKSLAFRRLDMVNGQATTIDDFPLKSASAA